MGEGPDGQVDATMLRARIAELEHRNAILEGKVELLTKHLTQKGSATQPAP